MIYCFDIDGTVCSSVQNSEYEKAIVFPEALREINRLYDEGHKIIFMTARGSVSGRDLTDITIQQLAEWGFKYHELITNRKPHADVFIDDKGINAVDWRKNLNVK
jgi:uncharacterized HAD superfamily protein